VYILASRYRGTIYTGTTSHLARRIWQHRMGHGSQFARDHGCTLLVHVERHETMPLAIAREKAVKKWLRAWKIDLIERDNPDWLDLYNRISN